MKCRQLKYKSSTKSWCAKEKEDAVMSLNMGSVSLSFNLYWQGSGEGTGEIVFAIAPSNCSRDVEFTICLSFTSHAHAFCVVPR